MMLISRIITEEDYPLINQWCRDWKFPEIAQKLLLPKYGVIIQDNNNVPIWLGFVYVSDSMTAWVEWILSNKFYKNKEIRNKAFVILFNEMINYAKTNSYKMFFMTVKDKFLIKRLKNIGFKETDLGMTNLIKEI